MNVAEHIWMWRGTYEWVVVYIWIWPTLYILRGRTPLIYMSHGAYTSGWAHMNVSWHRRMSHSTYLNQTHVLHAERHALIPMSHGTYEWVVAHAWVIQKIFISSQRPFLRYEALPQGPCARAECSSCSKPAGVASKIFILSQRPLLRYLSKGLVSEAPDEGPRIILLWGRASYLRPLTEGRASYYFTLRKGLVWLDSSHMRPLGKYRSLLQNIVCFMGLFCKKDLYFKGAYFLRYMSSHMYMRHGAHECIMALMNESSHMFFIMSCFLHAEWTTPQVGSFKI